MVLDRAARAARDTAMPGTQEGLADASYAYVGHAVCWGAQYPFIKEHTLRHYIGIPVILLKYIP